MDWQKISQIVLVELEKTGEANSCILAASVLIRVLALKGINGAYPLTVKPRIFNPKLTARLEREPLIDVSDVIHGLNEDGCAMVAIGHGEGDKDQWPAHLVVIVPQTLKEKDALVDLTITQANKPEWGIQIAPVMVGVRDAFLNGSEVIGVTINGCRVIYKAFPDDISFKDTSIWKGKLKRNLIVKRIMKSRI